MNKKNYLFKILIITTVTIFLFSLCNIIYGVEFNYDIQKIMLNYNYFDGFENDKIIRSKNDGTWYLLKSDGSKIELKGKYLDYTGIEKGEYLNYDEDYYRFLVSNKDNSIRFVYVDKNGLEIMVDGYSFADPTNSHKYRLLMNVDNDLNYKFGLYDKGIKKEIIPVIYENLWYFNDDVIIARNEEGEGVINIKQEEVIPFEYYNLQYLNDNFIIALGDKSKYGVINIENEELLPFEYDEIHKVSESNRYCRITKGNKNGLVDANNSEIVIPLEYESLYYVDEVYIGNELIVAQKDGKTGIIDVNNNVVVPFTYDNIQLVGNCLKVYKDGLAGLIDSKGNEILPAQAVDIMEVKDGAVTAIVYIEDMDHKYAVYNIEGEEIVPPIYDYIDYHASEKYMIVKKGWPVNLVDKSTGEEVLENSHYSDIRYINDKYFAGGSSSYFGIVNFAGQMLTPQYYNNISLVNVDGEDLLAALWHTNSQFDREIDYFKQIKGPSSWAVDEVSKAIENNLVPFEYQAAFTFNIKRYEFCSIIVEFLEEYYDTSREEIIKDKNIDVTYEAFLDGINEDIAICLNLGIVKGRGNGMFDGDSQITREEAAVMLTNMAEYLGLNTVADEAKLNDKTEISEWAMDAVSFVLKNKFMQGMGNGIFSPKSNITREQTYIIMYRILNETEFYSLFDKASEAWGWFYVGTMPLKIGPELSFVEVETESGTCFEVDYEGIETLKDLENYLKTIFTDEKVAGMLKSDRYFDVDAKLCAYDMARGTNHSYGKIAEVNKNIINENQIEYTLSVEKLDYNYELEGYEEFTFVTEKSGDFRVFSKFPAWW